MRAQNRQNKRRTQKLPQIAFFPPFLFKFSISNSMGIPTPETSHEIVAALAAMTATSASWLLGTRHVS
jgi:hypothetical protein